MSLVLLVGAGLMIQSFLRLRSVNIGVDTKNVLTATILLPRAKYTQDDQRTAFFKQLMERVRNLPGVEAASATGTLPLGGSTWGRGLTVEGYPVLSVGQVPAVQHTVVTPGYFRTMGITTTRTRKTRRTSRLSTSGSRGSIGPTRAHSASAFVLDHRKTTSPGTR
jgi:putative ABC transport system permease protein